MLLPGYLWSVKSQNTTVGAIKGVAKDNKANIYKVAF